MEQGSSAVGGGQAEKGLEEILGGACVCSCLEVEVWAAVGYMHTIAANSCPNLHLQTAV